jgi:plasmid stabilization system protein ParE
LADYPIRGAARDDIRPGLRTTSYKKRTVIAFAVRENLVLIVGIFHRGRDYESILALPDE